MTVVSISQAARLVRKGRQTLYNHNEKGKLSFTKTDDGKPGVDTSELERVYGKLYMPASKVETLVQGGAGYSGSSGQSDVGGYGGRKDAHLGLSKAVSMDGDVVSTLSWFMEQVDEAKEELAETQTQLAEREKTLAELRKAIALLPSPETVELRLAEQAEQLKREHSKALEVERTQQAKLLAEQKQREVHQAEQWKQSIAERQKEIQQARAEAETMKQQQIELDAKLKAEAERVRALESRGLIARLFNKKPMVTG